MAVKLYFAKNHSILRSRLNVTDTTERSNNDTPTNPKKKRKFYPPPLTLFNNTTQQGSTHVRIKVARGEHAMLCCEQIAHVHGHGRHSGHRAPAQTRGNNGRWRGVNGGGKRQATRQRCPKVNITLIINTLNIIASRFFCKYLIDNTLAQQTSYPHPNCPNIRDRFQEKHEKNFFPRNP